MVRWVRRQWEKPNTITVIATAGVGTYLTASGLFAQACSTVGGGRYSGRSGRYGGNGDIVCDYGDPLLVTIGAALLVSAFILYRRMKEGRE
jgi:hypothetical protein